MTFQTTFDLEVFIKSCNDLRPGVCSDGDATLDKWIALAEKKAVDGKITFTKQIVRNMNRYADAIADTGVSYVYGEDDEFSPELQLCLWALSPRYNVGSVLQIGDSVETLRWVAKHYTERFDAELEDAIKGIPYKRRLKYQQAFPTSRMTLKYVRSLDQVLADYNYDASMMDCIEKLYEEVDRYGHTRGDNKVITLIYQQLDTLLDNHIAFNTLTNSDNGRKALTEIFKSPKAFEQYWERVAAYGFKTEDRGGVKTVVGYSNWFIDMSIEVRGLLEVLNDLWDVYLPTKPVGARIMSKHYEISGMLPLEDKVYFTDLPLSAIQSLYPDFKVSTFKDFINGKPVNEPIIITYPERRTMAHVLLKDKYDKIKMPTAVNHPVIYVGWPDFYTRQQLNIVEYDGMLEVVERESMYTHRFGSMYGRPEIKLGDLYRDRIDKPYALDHIAKEEIGSSANNSLATYGRVSGTLRDGVGRGFSTPRYFNDIATMSDLHLGLMPRQLGKTRMVADFFKQWVDNLDNPQSDFDGDQLSFTTKKSPFQIEPEIGLTPAPVQYPVVHRNPILDIKDSERYSLHMGRPVFMGRHYAESIDESSPLMFGDQLHMPLVSTPRMEHIHSVSKMMAETMNEMFKRRHDGYSEPTVVSNPTELKDVFEGGTGYGDDTQSDSVVELPGDTVDGQALTPFNHQGTPSRLQMQAAEVDISEAYPKTRIAVNLASDEDSDK